MFFHRLQFREIKELRHKQIQYLKLFFRQIILGNLYIAHGYIITLKICHADKRLVPVDAVINDFGRRVLMGGIMKFILNRGKKLLCQRRLRIVVHRRRVNVGHLLIKIALAAPDIANPLQQFTEIAPAAIFQPIIVHRESLAYIFIETFCRPLAKLRTAQRFHTIAYRDDHIQIVVCNLICFPVRRSCCKICNNLFALQLGFIKDIFYMP